MGEAKTPAAEETAIPNFFEVWKAMYFAYEDVVTAGLRTWVNTRSYAVSIDMILNTYLQMQRFCNDLNNQFFAKTPLPSKTDLARVAELVIGVEDKIDSLESELDTRAITKDLRELKNELKEKLGGIDELSNQVSRIESSIDSLASAVKQLEKKVSAGAAPAKKTVK
ncbi:MAG: hypothetical protein HPY50_18880 [Firmicutes bacterium]|nr:hypothetical protein [Bacillota bacterium]